VTGFAPRRWSHVYVQRLVAPPERVLPLLTPLGEKAWASGWDPTILHEANGPGTVFRTSMAGRPDTIWLLERYDPAEGAVRYTRVTPRSDVTEIDLALAPADGGCSATVRYTFTTIGPLGDAVADRFTAAYYLEFMKEWEDELNACLSAAASPA
jgi:polyketide cyclase/dehydrase/lipid transport protein